MQCHMGIHAGTSLSTSIPCRARLQLYCCCGLCVCTCDPLFANQHAAESNAPVSHLLPHTHKHTHTHTGDCNSWRTASITFRGMLRVYSHACTLRSCNYATAAVAILPQPDTTSSQRPSSVPQLYNCQFTTWQRRPWSSMWPHLQRFTQESGHGHFTPPDTSLAGIFKFIQTLACVSQPFIRCK